MFIQVKELPNTLQSNLKRLGYGAKDIRLEIVNEIDLFDAGQSGRRGFAVCVNMDTGESKHFMGSWGGSNMFTTNLVDSDQTRHVIPVNGAVIKGSDGSQVYATVYVSSANLVPVLTETVELTPNEKGMLKLFRAYKASYRKDAAMSQFRNEFFDHGLTLGEYDALLKSLETKGMVKIASNGAASLTTKGKNG